MNQRISTLRGFVRNQNFHLMQDSVIGNASLQEMQIYSDYIASWQTTLILRSVVQSINATALVYFLFESLYYELKQAQQNQTLKYIEDVTQSN